MERRTELYPPNKRRQRVLLGCAVYLKQLNFLTNWRQEFIKSLTDDRWLNESGFPG